MKRIILIALLALFTTSVSAQKIAFGPVTNYESTIWYHGAGKTTKTDCFTTLTIYFGETLTEIIKFETVDLNDYFNPDETNWNATELYDEEIEYLRSMNILRCDTLVFGKKFVGWYRVTKDKKTEKNDLVDKPKSSNNKQNIYKI